ncbi:hypothetical protein [Methylobacterium sp. WCS2018Hpa-22]|uniref:hypothetical protein n=1 Tax=Methylobacterium sp. WCS2018Hpa-22 TaxID=3073633 RepID=UPI00288A0BD3|nr:hypothetical protein [Methylobacterium sp. WCS2018Hpa-22]
MAIKAYFFPAGDLRGWLPEAEFFYLTELPRIGESVRLPGMRDGHSESVEGRITSITHIAAVKPEDACIRVFFPNEKLIRH